MTHEIGHAGEALSHSRITYNLMVQGTFNQVSPGTDDLNGIKCIYNGDLLMSLRATIVGVALLSFASGCGTSNGARETASQPTQAEQSPAVAMSPSSTVIYDSEPLPPLSAALGQPDRFSMLEGRVPAAESLVAPVPGAESASRPEARTTVYTAFELADVKVLRGKAIGISEMIIEGGVAGSRYVEVENGPTVPAVGATVYAVVTSTRVGAIRQGAVQAYDIIPQLSADEVFLPESLALDEDIAAKRVGEAKDTYAVKGRKPEKGRKVSKAQVEAVLRQK